MTRFLVSLAPRGASSPLLLILTLTPFPYALQIDESIEDRIMAIQKRKTALVLGALGGSGDAAQTLENLKLIFGQ